MHIAERQPQLLALALQARRAVAGAAAAPLRCYASAAAAMEAPKAAICVIGDEVLAGSITDANTPWLAKVLTPPGLILAKAFRGCAFSARRPLPRSRGVSLTPPLQLLHSRGVDLVRAEYIPDDKARRRGRWGCGCAGRHGRA